MPSRQPKRFLMPHSPFVSLNLAVRQPQLEQLTSHHLDTHFVLASILDPYPCTASLLIWSKVPILLFSLHLPGSIAFQPLLSRRNVTLECCSGFIIQGHLRHTFWETPNVHSRFIPVSDSRGRELFIGYVQRNIFPFWDRHRLGLLYQVCLLRSLASF